MIVLCPVKVTVNFSLLCSLICCAIPVLSSTEAYKTQTEGNFWALKLSTYPDPVILIDDASILVHKLSLQSFAQSSFFFLFFSQRATVLLPYILIIIRNLYIKRLKTNVTCTCIGALSVFDCMLLMNEPIKSTYPRNETRIYLDREFKWKLKFLFRECRELITLRKYKRRRILSIETFRFNEVIARFHGTNVTMNTHILVFMSAGRIVERSCARRQSMNVNFILERIIVSPPIYLLLKTNSSYDVCV